MIRSHKLKSYMFFCLRGRVKSRGRKTRYISISTRPYCTQPELVMTYEKGSPPTMVNDTIVA